MHVGIQRPLASSQCHVRYIQNAFAPDVLLHMFALDVSIQFDSDLTLSDMSSQFDSDPLDIKLLESFTVFAHSLKIDGGTAASNSDGKQGVLRRAHSRPII